VEVVAVLIEWFVFLALLLFFGYAAWSDHPSRAGAAGERERRTESATLEGLLAAQVMSGQISRRQYRRAVAGLAARDDERDPLALPPEAGHRP
jgi:hypothetical protein